MRHSSEDFIIRKFEDTNQERKIEDYIFKIILRPPTGQWVKDDPHGIQWRVRVQLERSKRESEVTCILRRSHTIVMKEVYVPNGLPSTMVLLNNIDVRLYVCGYEFKGKR